MSASLVYPTVSFVISTEKGSLKAISLDERSSRSFPLIASRTTAQSAAVLQKGPNLSCDKRFAFSELCTLKFSLWFEEKCQDRCYLTYQTLGYAHHSGSTNAPKCRTQCCYATPSCRVCHWACCLRAYGKRNHTWTKFYPKKRDKKQLICSAIAKQKRNLDSFSAKTNQQMWKQRVQLMIR